MGRDGAVGKRERTVGRQPLAVDGVDGQVASVLLDADDKAHVCEDLIDDLINWISMISFTFAEGRKAVPVADGQADPLAGSDRSISDVAGEGGASMRTNVADVADDQILAGESSSFFVYLHPPPRLQRDIPGVPRP